MGNNNILGFSAGFHDSAVTILDGNTGEILFADHSERYSKTKHDPNLSPKLVAEALTYGTIRNIAYYENHLLKNLRQWRAGQNLGQLNWKLRTEIKQHFPQHSEMVDACNVSSFGHHKSHAAAGFQTSPYDKATVVVIDAIGEFDTITIWDASYDKNGNARYKLVWKQGYPDSIGLFYSAITKSVGLRPLDEEYILMGMSAYGDPLKSVTLIRDKLVETDFPPRFKDNLHIGIDKIHNNVISEFDVAAGAQVITEHMIEGIIAKSKYFDKSNNLVFMGGVALNCVANRHLGKYYKNIWIMPNPGDAGSSLGAAALQYGKKIQWKDAYLGYNIQGDYPVKEALQYLLKYKMVGVASGRSEFGPRALGNRSLLADPRGPDVKRVVNSVKQRQQFRPFAPVILEEFTNKYFWMPAGFKSSPYMQVTAKCMQPDTFPAIIHADGTSRVQTVPDDGSGIRRLLEAWYAETGCPMLLNTSLNIRGEPMVLDIADAARFEELYGVKVFTSVL